MLARIGELETQLVAGKSELQPKLDAVTVAREAAAEAEARARRCGRGGTQSDTRPRAGVCLY